MNFKTTADLFEPPRQARGCCRVKRRGVWLLLCILYCFLHWRCSLTVPYKTRAIRHVKKKNDMFNRRCHLTFNFLDCEPPINWGLGTQSRSLKDMKKSKCSTPHLPTLHSIPNAKSSSPSNTVRLEHMLIPNECGLFVGSQAVNRCKQNSVHSVLSDRWRHVF